MIRVFANVIAVVGLVLVAYAGFLVHPALGVSTIGVECIAISIGIVRMIHNNEGRYE